MHSSPHRTPTLLSLEKGPEISTQPLQAPTRSRRSMLKITSLLNPPTLVDKSSSRSHLNPSANSTPPFAIQTPSSMSLFAKSQVPTSSSSSQKSTKEYTVGKLDECDDKIKYPPFECAETDICLTPNERQELARQHKRFKVSTLNDKPGLISSQKRYIPYASDKKSFGDKTGRSGFEAFVYTFRDPNDTGKVYEVMWDFFNGLTRITPFFKACGYAKTAPAKAIQNNPGLKDLSFSITGGSLKAQGYWMPYSCARAICLTFCYDIRHLLTPIFGPSFVRECLPKDHPGFARFKIDAEIIRCAQMEAEGWTDSPRVGHRQNGAIPRSVPQHETIVSDKELRPRLTRPLFKETSPFDSDSGDDARSLSSAVDSVEVSPKTTHSGPTWIAINQRQDRSLEPMSSPYAPLSESLLRQPHHAFWPPSSAYTNDGSNDKSAYQNDRAVVCRDSPHKRRRSSTQNMTPNSTDTDKRQRRQTRQSSSKRPYSASKHVDDKYSSYQTDVSESESDDVDITISSSRQPGQDNRKSVLPVAHSSTTGYTTNTDEESRSKKYSPADFRAARWLLNLHTRDAKLSPRSSGSVRLGKSKSKAGL